MSDPLFQAFDSDGDAVELSTRVVPPEGYEDIFCGVSVGSSMGRSGAYLSRADAMRLHQWLGEALQRQEPTPVVEWPS